MNCYEVRAIAQTEIKKALRLFKTELDHRLEQGNSVEAQLSLLAVLISITATINKIGEQDETR